MKILVTGATGIIGTHVVRALRTNHEIMGADRNRAGEDDLVKVDIAFPEEVHKAFEEVRPELVIHMAGEVGRLNGEKFPERMIRTNVLGTLNIALSCLKSNSKLINFSTSEVYGEAFDNSFVHEGSELPALGQNNIYSISKMAGEAVVRHYVDNYGLRACTVRPFMLYGEGERPNKFRSALTNFVAAALHNQPLTVHRGTVRSWCHVDDFIRGLELLLQLPMERYEAYNIGNDTNYTTAEETAKVVCVETGAPFDLIQLVDPPKTFMSPIKRASLSKIRALGYEPRISLREGVQRVVKWQRENCL